MKLAKRQKHGGFFYQLRVSEYSHVLCALSVHWPYYINYNCGECHFLLLFFECYDILLSQRNRRKTLCRLRLFLTSAKKSGTGFFLRHARSLHLHPMRKWRSNPLLKRLIFLEVVSINTLQIKMICISIVKRKRWKRHYVSHMARIWTIFGMYCAVRLQKKKRRAPGFWRHWSIWNGRWATMSTSS